jgi:zinc protease
MTTLTRTLAGGFAAVFMAVLSAGSAVAFAAELPAFVPPAPVIRTLPNGLRVAVFQDHRLPLVHLQLLLPAGGAQDAVGTPGVANATALLLRAGTSSRTAAAFAAAVDDLGGSINAAADRDYSAVNGTFLSADFEAGLELFADVVVNPTFPPEQVERFRAQAAAQLLPARQDPAAQAEDRLWAIAFQGHPYGRSPLGTFESLRRLDRGAVRAFHRDFYRPDRAVLAIAGDVELERAFAVANDQFGSWAGRATAPASLPVPAPPAAMRIQLVDRPGLARSEVRIGLVGPSRTDPDALPLQAANYILGGGPSSRFTRSLQGEGVPPSDVRSAYTILRDAGLVSLGGVARNDSVALLVVRMRDELARLRTQPPGEAEVAAVQRYFENTYPLQFQTPEALITQWMGADFYGLTSAWLDHYVENISAVTAAQVTAAASRWLDPSRCVVVVVGPVAELRVPLEAVGPVEVIVARDGAAVAAPVVPPVVPPLASPGQKKRGRELLARTFAAHGGLERLRRVTDTTLEGDMVVQADGRTLTLLVRQIRKEPFRMRYSTRISSMENGQILDGTRGWLYSSEDSLQVTSVDSVGVEVLRAVFRSDVVHSLLAAADPAVEVAWLGPGRADGRDADVLEVTSAAPPGGGPAEQRLLYLDVTDHRLIAEDLGDAGMRASPLAVRRVYRDYRTVAGVPWPFYEERLRGGTKTMTLSLLSVTINTGVSDMTFEPPAPEVKDLPLR